MFVAATNVKSKTAKVRPLQFTSEGNLVSSRNQDGSGFDYSPPLKYFEFPLYPGKTWQQTSQETNWLFRYVISASIHGHFRPMPHESASYSRG
jgi:hypothetical protein